MITAINKKSFIRRLIERSPKWASKRHAPDKIPYKISGRRIYIIPTRFGLIFALAVFALLLGSMNYSNGLAFLLTFILTAVGFVAMHLTHSNLANILIEPMLNDAVFSGENALLQLRIWHKDTDRPEINITHNSALANLAHCCVEKNGSIVSLHMQTQQRGYLEIDHYMLSTRFPMNMFFAWSVVLQPLRCLVYPKPSDESPEVFGDSSQSESHKSSNKQGQDDFAGLRDYQWQDSPQHIAWKSYASQDKLLVKQFSESVSKTSIFDIDALSSGNVETRLSQLCRLILNAEEKQQNYGLKLGNTVFAASHGDTHKHNCLSALATYQLKQFSDVGTDL